MEAAHLLTIRAAAERLAISTRGVYRLIEAGKLERVYPLGTQRTARITSASVDRYLAYITRKAKA